MSPSEKNFINIHSHRKSLSAGEWVLRNAFHFLDKQNLSNLNYAVSVGLHPWYVTKDYEKQINKVRNLLQLNNVLALGETGLDKAYNSDFTLQKKAFEAQLELAVQCNKPVIIHSVKSYPDLISYIKKFQIHFILHQYRGNIQQTQQFLKQENVSFSLGKDLAEENKKVTMSFKEIPFDRIFLETDVSHYTIQEVYQKASVIKETSVEELKIRIYKNYISVFGKTRNV